MPDAARPRLTCPKCQGSFPKAHGHAKRHISRCDGSERARQGREGRWPKPALTEAECNLALQLLRAPTPPCGWKAAAAAVSRLRIAAGGDAQRARVSVRWLGRALQARGVLEASSPPADIVQAVMP